MVNFDSWNVYPSSSMSGFFCRKLIISVKCATQFPKSIWIWAFNMCSILITFSNLLVTGFSVIYNLG